MYYRIIYYIYIYNIYIYIYIYVCIYMYIINRQNMGNPENIGNILLILIEN